MPSKVTRSAPFPISISVAMIMMSAMAAVPPAFGESVVPTAGASTTSPEVRVATIGYRLVVRNLDRCPRSAPVTGLLLHDQSAYPARDRAAIAIRFDLGEGFGVRGVVPGSPADEAGLQAGDELLALEGVPVARMPLPAPRTEASYDRVEGFMTILVARLRQGTANMLVRRGRETLTVRLAQRLGCSAQFTLMPDKALEAWSDERYVAVTSGLAEVAQDDELAFVMAHELAHIALGHGAGRQTSLAGLGVGSGKSRQREREADRLGLAMSMAAGYDRAGAEALLTRLARANPLSFSLTHPSTRARIQELRAAAVR